MRAKVNTETVLGLDSVSRYPTSGVGELEARSSSLGWSACRRKSALHRGKVSHFPGPIDSVVLTAEPRVDETSMREGPPRAAGLSSWQKLLLNPGKPWCLG
ncbi:hypothetical protein JOQ06_020809, partial [Pogonophryne albipinna]